MMIVIAKIMLIISTIALILLANAYASQFFKDLGLDARPENGDTPLFYFIITLAIFAAYIAGAI